MTDSTTLSDVFSSDSTAWTDRENADPAGSHIAPLFVFGTETTDGFAADSALELGGTGTIAVTEVFREKSPLEIIRLISSTERSKSETKSGAGSIPESSIILQHWEGVVLFREEETFTARIFEGYRDFPAKRAEISLQEVVEQLDLVVPGAMFSWIIGYRVRGRTRTRFSEIYFRRLPPWTKQELSAAITAADKLGEEAGWY